MISLNAYIYVVTLKSLEQWSWNITCYPAFYMAAMLQLFKMEALAGI